MKKALKYAYIGLMLFFLYAPIMVLVVFSFNESRSRVRWTGFTFDWYRELFNNPRIADALTTTLIVGILSTVFAVIIGTMAAIAIHRLRSTRKKLDTVQEKTLLGFTRLSMSSPEIILGVSLMVSFVFFINTFRLREIGFNMGFQTLLLSHIAFNVPYVVMSVLPRLSRIDERIYEAAMDLGASPFTAFRKTMLPQLKPGIISAAMIAFTLSIDDVVVSTFTAGATTNLSILIFSQARRGVNPSINALSTIMFIVVMFLLYVINAIDKKTKKNVQDDNNEGVLEI
ncbi:MAG: ABC transporter permease [Oscillospiraceae bacterium]|nr:ABC transporter permease [Oscillospiraceae bacterium]